MLMKDLLLPAHLLVKLILSTTSLIVLLTVVKNKTWVRQSMNSVLDVTFIKVIAGNINVVKPVCNNHYMSIFAAATIIVL